MIHLLDVSHYQTPKSLDWGALKTAGWDGGIARMTYGTRPDRHAAEHVARMRDAGVLVGGYHFFRPTEEVRAQGHAFREASERAGYGMPGDLIPDVDIEDDTEKRPILPAHAALAEEMVALTETLFSVELAMIYITQRDWGRLGKPAFVLRRPLHVAHYASPNRVEPATPNGVMWDGWQCTVAPLAYSFPLVNGYREGATFQVDQNRFRRIRLLDGSVFESDLPQDEQMPAERGLPDTDGTAEHRARVLESIVRAAAVEAAQLGYFDMLGDMRRAAHREMAGSDTEPPSDTADTLPPEGETS